MSLAHDLVFPRPRSIEAFSGEVETGSRLGVPPGLPGWLRRRLCKAADGLGLRLTRGRPVAPLPGTVSGAYRLRLHADGTVELAGADEAGTRHAVITLALLLEAAAAGATLVPIAIEDAPAFEVRGLQVDMAREYFPRLPYLKRLVDRMADLKLNTLWLYLENHLDTPAVPHLSPLGGMTPDEARAISAYGAARGVDVVPGTNVLSHMEGWFRLERYADLADGAQRSYPVLTRPEVWELVRAYLDELIEAFPSPNLHAGLDELLFTGTNPEAAEAIAAQGKPGYFADFAVKVVDYLQSRGRRVWIWDDMVLGKNVHRAEGFNDDYRLALDRLPRDVVMTHWYYWVDTDGKHRPIIERVGAAGRPFVVAPSSRAYLYDCGHLQRAVENQYYLAGCGREYGAFGFVNTHWESRYGASFEAGWPLHAVSAAFAWGGDHELTTAERRALGFVLTGDTDGALWDYFAALDPLQIEFLDRQLGPRQWRELMFLDGPPRLWQTLHPRFSPADRAAIRATLGRAAAYHRRLGTRDPGLAEAVLLPVRLLTAGLDLLDAFDEAWVHYHAAAVAQPEPAAAVTLHAELAATRAALTRAATGVAAYRQAIRRLERTGHTPYDGYALGRHLENLRQLVRLIDRLERLPRLGLPRFDKLLDLPDVYHLANLTQFAVQNGQGNPGSTAGLPWPKRWG